MATSSDRAVPSGTVSSSARPRLLLLSSGVRDHDWACERLGGDAWLITCSGEETLLAAALAEMRLRWGVPDRVVPLDGRSIPLAARLREVLGLAAQPVDSAPRDRRETHQRAVAAGLRTVQLLDRATLEDWDFRTPVIAKPVSRADAGIRRLTSSYDLADLDPDADMLFEEWVIAPVCHVEGIAVDGGIAAARLFYYVGPGAGRVPVTDQRALTRLTEAAADVVAGMALPDGAFHIELFDLPTNPMLLDVLVPLAPVEDRARTKSCVATRDRQRARASVPAGDPRLALDAFRFTAA
ncbi:ATP-grasp domain-containing protein [Allokutzneria albata]|uniref:ATP-grasp domain-containing protein n=1 Tax=Allokutzneria albata TaxID=211114 RepID=A0A1G9WZK2_ALLAB|nr:hypothetical protein [Allokutzneria albata]SDM89878.1 hypothetical protein SAMN04489726_3902 [Allokutzneria albata]